MGMLSVLGRAGARAAGRGARSAPRVVRQKNAQRDLALLMAYLGGTGGLGAWGAGELAASGAQDRPYGDPDEARARGREFGAGFGPLLATSAVASGPFAPVISGPMLVGGMAAADMRADAPRAKRQRVLDRQALEQALREYEMERMMATANAYHGERGR